MKKDSKYEWLLRRAASNDRKRRRKAIRKKEAEKAAALAERKRKENLSAEMKVREIESYFIAMSGFSVRLDDDLKAVIIRYEDRIGGKLYAISHAITILELFTSKVPVERIIGNIENKLRGAMRRTYAEVYG